jgi:sugar-specific transcriptional regulator TrmB
MEEDIQMELQELGLLPAEAQVYLALVRNGALGGSAIASVTGFPRSSVYLTLNSLLDKGLVEGGASRGSHFSVVPPEQALPSLVIKERESLVQRETLANKLGQRLSTLVEPIEARPEELIQIIRNPRAVAERYDRLRLQARESVEVFVKAPIFSRPSPDPVLEELLRRGVLCRGLYERAILDSPAVGPYLAKWVADGDEVRVYEGKLPHKLALFDRQSAFVALSMPGDQMRTVYIRHPELANSLGILFDTFWEKSEPLAIADQKKSPGDTGAIRLRKRTGNGQASRSRK